VRIPEPEVGLARSPGRGMRQRQQPLTVVAPCLAAHYGQGMGSSTDLLSLLVATLAVVLSLITVALQRRQQRREAYRGIYEILMSEQLQRGRWLI